MKKIALVIRHVAFEDLGVLAPLLTERGYIARYLQAGVDSLDAEALVAADLVVILGGPIGVYETDRYPFLAAEQQAIAARIGQDKPTLGICLGAQMCARQLGGKVFKHPSGHAEIGYYPIRPTQAGRAVVETWPECVYQWHREGFDVPPGAELLAEGDTFEVQAIRCGRAFALQFHPDVTHAMMHKWTTRGHDRMELPGAKPEIVQQASALNARAAGFEFKLPQEKAAGLLATLDKIMTPVAPPLSIQV